MADQFARPSYPLELPSYQDYAATAEESIAPDLWHGCVGLWVPALGPTGRFLEDLTHLSGNATASLTAWKAGPYGHEVDIDSQNARAHNVAVDSTHPLAGASDVSLVAICSSSVFASSAVFSIRNGTGTSDAFIFRPYDTNAGDGAFLFMAGSARANENTAPAGRVDDIPRVFILRYDGSTSEIFVDGVSVATNSHTSTISTTPTDIDIGRWRIGSQLYNGAISLIAIYDRYLDDGEVLTWARGPFDIVTPVTWYPGGRSVAAAAVGHDWLSAAIIDRHIADIVRR